MDKLIVRGTEINVQWDLKRDDFLSLTDIAKIKDSDNPRYIIPVRRTRAYENMADLAGAPALTAAEKSKGVITVAGRSNPKDDCPCNQDGKAGRKGAASRAAEALAALPQAAGFLTVPPTPA